MGDRTGWFSVVHTSAGSGDERALVRNVVGWPTYELFAGRVGSTARELGAIRLRWYDVDPNLNPGASSSAEVSWDFYTVDVLPLTGPHHGDFLEVTLQNPGSGRQIQVSHADTNAPEERHRTMQPTGLLLNAVWSNVPAGGSGLAAYALAASGPVTFFFGAPSQKAEFRINSGGAALADVVLDPTTDDKSRIVTIDAPRAQLSVSVINRGSIAAGFSARATTGNA